MVLKCALQLTKSECSCRFAGVSRRCGQQHVRQPAFKPVFPKTSANRRFHCSSGFPLFIVASLFGTSGRSRSALRSTYTALAPLYDRLVPHISDQARTLGRSWLEVQNGERVLDVGTGTGLALGPLARSNSDGWTDGVDLTPAMLRHARKRLELVSHARYSLHEARATALPFPDSTFDAVFSSYLVDVLPADQLLPALQEMHRVLQPHGRLVLVYLALPQRPVERLWVALARHLPVLLGGARPVALQPRLQKCGFQIQAHATRVQIGLRSAIVKASPSQA